MLKNLFFLLVSLLFVQGVKAQKRDTIIYYMKNPKQVVKNKDSADYTIYAILPAKNSKSNLITLREYYSNGNPKLSGTAAGNTNYISDLILSGEITTYYPNGNKKNVSNYDFGTLIGKFSQYYPDGSLYANESYDRFGNLLLGECIDTAGNILATNGYGKWIIYDDDFKQKTLEGHVTDSLREGIWHSFVNDTIKYEAFYHRSVIVYSTEPYGLISMDTIKYYFKSPDILMNSSDGADYYRLLTATHITVIGEQHQVNEFYMNGKLKFTGLAYSTPRTYMILLGPNKSYYPNGKLKSVTTVDGLVPVATKTNYYPNGRLYSITTDRDDPVEIIESIDPYLVECRDSTGKILTQNGTGKWVTYDDDFKKITAEGEVYLGSKVGEWQGKIGDSCRYECLYVNGKATTGTGYDKNGIAHSFTRYKVLAEFKGGMPSFYKYIQRKMSYPSVDRKNNVEGSVFVNFTIDPNGNVINVQALRGPSATLEAEAAKIVKLSPPWNPGTQWGLPANMVFTLPVSFYLKPIVY